MKNRQIIHIVKRAIYGYSGPRKWAVATKFVESLTDEQRDQFLAEYQKLQRTDGNPMALLKAARAVGSTVNIAAELMTPPADPRDYRMGSSSGRQQNDD